MYVRRQCKPQGQTEIPRKAFSNKKKSPNSNLKFCYKMSIESVCFQLFRKGGKAVKSANTEDKNTRYAHSMRCKTQTPPRCPLQYYAPFGYHLQFPNPSASRLGSVMRAGHFLVVTGCRARNCGVLIRVWKIGRAGRWLGKGGVELRCLFLVLFFGRVEMSVCFFGRCGHGCFCAWS